MSMLNFDTWFSHFGRVFGTDACGGRTAGGERVEPRPRGRRRAAWDPCAVLASVRDARTRPRTCGRPVRSLVSPRPGKAATSYSCLMCARRDRYLALSSGPRCARRVVTERPLIHSFDTRYERDIFDKASCSGPASSRAAVREATPQLRGWRHGVLPRPRHSQAQRFHRHGRPHRAPRPTTSPPR